MRPTWLEINLANIRHNLSEIKTLLSPLTKLMGIVKADAYGHGAVEVAKVILESKADCLGVATVEEAVCLRRDGGIKAPILTLDPLFKDELLDVLEQEIRPTLFSWDMAKKLSCKAAKYKKGVNVHIKIDTGMWRVGVHWEEAIPFIKRVMELPYLKIEGIFSHLATAYCADKSYAKEQSARFLRVIEGLRREGIDIPIKHLSSSAGILDLPQMNFDMVRPGITLYGLFPSKSVNRRCKLKPAMSFKTRIVSLEKVPAGSGVSYGRTYITKKDSVVAVLPVGYADGYSRVLSNRGEVLIRGVRAPIIGAICMDCSLVDVTHIPQARVGDEVVLFGSQGKEKIEVESIAELCQTISYEIITRIGKRVKRVYKGGEDAV